MELDKYDLEKRRGHVRRVEECYEDHDGIAYQQLEGILDLLATDKISELGIESLGRFMKRLKVLLDQAAYHFQDKVEEIERHQKKVATIDKRLFEEKYLFRPKKQEKTPGVTEESKIKVVGLAKFPERYDGPDLGTKIAKNLIVAHTCAAPDAAIQAAYLINPISGNRVRVDLEDF